MPEVTLSSVIERLDLVDGVADNRYTDLSLRVNNSTGACELGQMAREEMTTEECGTPPMYVYLTNQQGEQVYVDCGVLTQRLNTLVGIAEKLPSFDFMADVRARNQSSSPQSIKQAVDAGTLSREDVFSYFIVDHMISALLLGYSTTQDCLPVMFLQVEFDIYTTVTNYIADNIGTITGDDIDIQTSVQAFELFERLGEKYGFETESFRPPE